MVLYLGEAVQVRAIALDPATRDPLDPPPLESWVRWWRPGRNPVRDPTLRGSPDFGPRAMLYREARQDWVAYEPTDVLGWEAGRWTYEVRMIGTNFTNFEYGTVMIRE